LAAAETDYQWTVPFYWADRDEELKAALEGLAVWWRAKQSTGTEPADFLTGIELGDSGAHNDMRLAYDGTSFLLQRNTGSEGSPTWATFFTVAIATGNITAANDVSITGNLDMTGGTITNAASVNAISPTAHGTRHQPGGADALTVATAADIGATNTEGVSNDLARADHQHRGVRSFQTLFGDVTLTAGTGVLISGTTITALTNSYGYADATPANITLSATTPTAVGGFANLAFPGADGAADYIVRFTGTLTTAGGAEQTLFTMHVGTAGTISDTVVAHDDVETAAIGDPGKVVIEALVTNPSASSRVTIGYDSTTGSRHTLEGGSDGRPVLTIIRLTAITTH
jgi:hypothetical protein